MKSSPAMPPPVDTKVTEKTEKLEKQVEQEKQKMIDTKKKGKAGTILTSGMGVTEEAETGKTMLGGVLQ